MVSRKLQGVWSATPTPFTADFGLDVESVRRLVAHHIGMGVEGLLLAGTCGEGPWMRDCDREALTQTAKETAAGRLRIALQVTANSPGRVLDNIERAAAAGAELAVVAAPYFAKNDTPERMARHYIEVSRHSLLPVCFYDFGSRRSFPVPDTHLAEVLNEPNIVMVKDNSRSEARRLIYLEARQARPDLALFTGNELDCARYLYFGYDGLLIGSGIFSGRLAARILRAARAGNLAEAQVIQKRMNELMDLAYGGRQQEYWLAGLKELLVKMGVFSTHLNLPGYTITDSIRARIHAAVDGVDGLGYREDLLGQESAGLPAGRSNSGM